MADSDGEYVQEISDDETNAHQVTRGGDYGTRSSGRGARGSRAAGQAAQPKARWEDIQRSWDHVVEGADGSISGTIEGLLEAGKRKRLLRDTTPLQRGIIRHLLLVLDLSDAMKEKDLRPTRYLLTLRYAQEFVVEFFEQNPISQLGIIGMRDGLAVRISDMSGNPSDHVSAIEALRPQDPKGDPSLQNVLEMARAALFHTPSHGTREVLIIFGALYSSDPGDIHETIRSLIADKIRVNVVGLAAQVAICRELCTKTNNGDDSQRQTATYTISLSEPHFRELFLALTTPPLTLSTPSTSASTTSLLQMGFPSRTLSTQPSLCACHSRATKQGYLCSRCSSKVCSLPIECPACGLTLILSTHLARSYHHLFPLRNWKEVGWRDARRSRQCFGCLAPFPSGGKGEKTREMAATGGGAGGGAIGSVGVGVSPTSRYECEACHQHFCIDCDLFAHEVLHNCPGCQSLAPRGGGGGAAAAAAAGSGSGADSGDIDSNGVDGVGVLENGNANANANETGGLNGNRTNMSDERNGEIGNTANRSRDEGAEGVEKMDLS
ncbi:MAG: hypothetical protein M1819_005179 [Sarea resinae]|nr:MAG: hypothetical protein M1819_005179 [Sarea resinae]